LAFICLVALGLRALNYESVFQAGEVHFQDGDAWFHMRTIHNLLHHFPRRSGFDPYSGFPSGQPVTTGPFFDLTAGTLAWVLGFGSPSPALIDIVGAWYPVILAALIPLPVFFLGRALFHPLAGLFAAALVATLPGNLLMVSRLGVPDHHVAEILTSTLMLLFLVLALEGKRPVLYAVLSGVSFGCFLATRPAGAFLIAGLGGWFVLQSVRDSWDGTRSGSAAGIAIATIVIAWILFLPAIGLVWSDFTILSLASGLAVIVFVAGLSALLRARAFPRWTLAVLLVGVAALTTAAIVVLKPPPVVSLAHTVARYVQNGPSLTVRELRPLLTIDGSFSMSGVWVEFGVCWIPALAVFVWLSMQSFRRNRPALNLLLVWSALMICGTVLQNRMSYFCAVNLAVLTGYFCWRAVEMARDRVLIGAVLAMLLVAPNLFYAWRVMQGPAWQTQDWTDTMAWLRANTPEPFENASAFDGYYPALSKGESFRYPASAYGVMNWWDYGHLISALGRRIPVANGMQTGAADAAQFFLETNPGEAQRLLQKDGARFIIADATLPIPGVDHMRSGNGAFGSMPLWANKSLDEYMGVYTLHAEDGSRKEVAVFYPAYYRSMMARLYLFDGRAVEPEGSTWVLEYSKREILKSRHFETYQEALAFMQAHRGEPLLLAGLNPLKSCVPLEELKEMHLAYSSMPGPLAAGGQPIQAVKVFAYTGR
jgi:dolichyl-diphosphooligosaccharide--protein glycosyltransferase